MEIAWRCLWSLHGIVFVNIITAYGLVIITMLTGRA